MHLINIAKIAITIQYFLILIPLFGQERFETWVAEDQFLLSKIDGAKEKLYNVNLVSGKSKEWSNGANRISHFDNEMSLLDGTLIQYRDHDLYLIKADGSDIQLTNDDAEEKNPKLSADKTNIAYTKNNDLYYFDLDLLQEFRLTYDGSKTIYNGWASWVYYEEILGRSSRYAAFWWSPDSKKIAFLRFDDRPVPTFTLVREEGQHGSLEVMHYPKAGDPNPDVQFGIAELKSQEIIWIDEDRNKDQYSAMPFWTPDGRYLLIQELNRGQDTLRIVRIDPQDGSRKLIYEETQKTWVDFFEEIQFINDQEFILRSSRQGWNQLYRYDIEGKLLASLTPSAWNVTDIHFLDQINKRIYFYGTGEVNTDQHFFCVDLDGSDFKKITNAPGWHDITSAPGYKYFLDDFSSIDQPGQQRIVDQNGNIIYSLENGETNENQLAGVKVEKFTINTEDGFDLPAIWILPKDFDSQKKYPVVFTVYGGPDRQDVKNIYRSYTSDFYANHQIIRIVVDHRGSGKFGRKGLDYMHRNLGKWEVEDLISAVKWLRKLSFIDADRIGITGGSYGGYVTCMALTYGADYFTHGVSLFPVTDWHLYDNVYTERYMDTPAENPDGYRFGSAMEHAHKLKGKLLIVHGTMDDNVHMQNTLQLISKFQDLGKDFEMMMYPGERHGWGGAKRTHLNKLVNQFWKEHFDMDQPVKSIQP